MAKFDITDPSMKTLTTKRCIEHTERTHPSDYKSVQAECIQNPRLNPEFELLKDKVGPREAKLEREMRAAHCRVQQAESTFKLMNHGLNKIEMDGKLPGSTEQYQAEAIEEGSTGLTQTLVNRLRAVSSAQGTIVGGKIKQKWDKVETDFKQTQAAAYTANRKVEYVSEYGRNFLQEGASRDLPANANMTSNYVSDNAISFYSDSVERGNVTFPTTMTLSHNPFRKSSAFSADSRTDATVHRSESNERPRHLPTVKEFANLKAFREKMISAKVGPGQSPTQVEVVGPIIDAVWGLIDSDKPTSSLSHFLKFLEWEHNLKPTEAEKFALLSAFDVYATDSIDIPTFTDYLSAAIVVPMDGEGRPVTADE